MKENQNIEWKQSWRDEYLKWICGFANADGGTLEIGRDDAGNILGISNALKLLEDLPNKIRDILGIIVDLNLHTRIKKTGFLLKLSLILFQLIIKVNFIIGPAVPNKN